MPPATRAPPTAIVRTPTLSRVSAPSGAAHLYSTERLSDRVVHRKDDQIAQIDGATPIADPLQVRATNESAQPISLDMIRVRRSTYPFPTVALGSPQTNP